MRRLLFLFFGIRSVVLKDFDGELSERIVGTHAGRPFAWRMSRTFRIGRVYLNEDGSTTGAIYVHWWGPLYGEIF